MVMGGVRDGVQVSRRNFTHIYIYIYIFKLGHSRISILSIKKKKKKSYLLYFLESNMAHVRKFCQQKMNIKNQIFVFKY